MTRIERYKHDADADPVISFATEADIEFADELRHLLEELYFARPPLTSNCSDEILPSLRPVDDAGGAL
jgi:hypothetical protein